METQNQVSEKILAGRELLDTTRRNIQLLDDRIGVLQAGRQAVEAAGDVSSEHRVAFLGAVSEVDQSNGILIGAGGNPLSFGFQNLKTGIIRAQEDAAFVCTNVLVALRRQMNELDGVPNAFTEAPEDRYFSPWLRLTDVNTGRNLVSGLTTGPLDRDRGAVPAAYFSSFRQGLGSNVKNKLFSEFTVPRAGTVRVTVYNMGVHSLGILGVMRLYITLLGYKVFGV